MSRARTAAFLWSTAAAAAAVNQLVYLAQKILNLINIQNFVLNTWKKKTRTKQNSNKLERIDINVYFYLFLFFVSIFFLKESSRLLLF